MTPNTPADVSIASTVPLSREEFGERLGDSDWLSRYRSFDPGQIDGFWRDDYLPMVVEPFQELSEEAARLGVNVTKCATLSTLGELTERSRIVVLFTHWKGSAIVFDDLISPDPLRELMERAATDNGDLAKYILTRLRTRRGIKSQSPWRRMGSWLSTALGGEREESPSATVLEVLNDALLAPLPIETVGADGLQILESEVSREARRRDEMDELFAGLLRPGNRLELFDGMQPKRRVEETIAPAFDGVLDLANCTSTVLADYLARRRKNLIRTVQFPTHIDFGWAAQALKGTLQLLEQGQFSYQEARIRVAKEIDDNVCRT